MKSDSNLIEMRKCDCHWQFQPYRTIVDDIVEHLNSVSAVIRVIAFTGQASSTESKGQNQGQELRVMDLFHQVRYNVIVSMSIGEVDFRRSRRSGPSSCDLSERTKNVLRRPRPPRAHFRT
jgi:hypothetical protein